MKSVLTQLGLAAVLVAVFTVTTPCQPPPDPGTAVSEPPPALDGGLDNLPGMQGLPGMDFGAGGMGPAGQRVTLDASFRVKKAGSAGELSVHVAVQPGWHIYSTTQPAGGPLRTEIEISKPKGVELAGPFAPDHDPFLHEDPAYPGLSIEEFAGDVTWTAPIRLPAGADPESLVIDVVLNGQVCVTNGACELVSNETVSAQFEGYLANEGAATSFQADDQRITISGYLDAVVTAPGSTVNLVLTAKLQGDWHVYAYAPKDPEKVARPTLIVLRKLAGFQHGPPQANLPPKEEQSGMPKQPVLRYHEKEVSWTVPIEVPVGTSPGAYEIAGSIGYQTCTHDSCDDPTGLDFAGTIAVASSRQAGRSALTFRPRDYDGIAKLAATQKQQAAHPTAAVSSWAKWLEKQSRWTILALAFLAGLILNVMPCVLPVLGLKLMAFVQQAGGNRWEIFSLNLWFSVGLVFVFWILAALAVVFHMGWGEQFNNAAFTITMIGIVFAFGLAFLGVWQVPIPGFVSSNAVQGMAEREGAFGAFSKGILTTLLATPCAGPLVIPLMSWTVTQPPWLTYTLFTSMGLGMASPYLAVGAMPALIRLLPKPGDWMTTFEHVLGFVLMATAIFLLNSVRDEMIIPAITLMLGISVACWWIGRTPVTASALERFRAWGTAIVMIAFFAWFSFNVIKIDRSQQLPWQPFSRVALDQHLQEGRTVMVDFTAHW